MTESREAEVRRTFVSLASSLARGYDVVDLLDTLTLECARLLDVESAGLLLADNVGVLHVMSATTHATRQLEVLQLQRNDGPCRDCYHGGTPVSVADLDEALDRWPQFGPAARAVGIASVHAVPMRLRDNLLGALGLFGTSAGSLNDDDLALGQAMADVATVALVQDRAASNQSLLNEQLQAALSSRVVLEQAKGVLAQRGDLEMGDAFAALRRFARDHRRPLSEVAREVVTRVLPAQQLLDHARSAGVLQA